MSQVETLPNFLKASFKDAVFYSLMVGMGESYLVAYALALGIGEMQSGLIAVIPMLFGATVQLFAGYGVWILGSRKNWICLCSLLQAFSLIALAQLSLFKLSHNALELWIFSLACVYWASALSAGPTWNVWMGRIVPEQFRLQFFSSRTRVAQLAVFLGLVGGGIVLEYAKQTPLYMEIFSSLFLLAGVFRLLSAFFIFRQEANGTEADRPPPKAPSLFERTNLIIKRPNLLRIVGYLFFLNCTVFIAAPFFNPFMLKQLEMGFVEYTALISASFLARVMANDLFVNIARNHGVKSLLLTGAFSIAPLPLMWVFSDYFPYLLLLQILSGFAWGSHELGVTLILLEEHSDSDRSLVLTLANLCNYLGMFAGGLIGAKILASGPLTLESYYRIFWISSVARLIPAMMLVGIENLYVKGPIRKFYTRILSVRPGGSSIFRPIFFPEGRKKNKKRTSA